MRVWPEQIEVLVSSFGEDNPYEEHEKADLGTGLYCETVIASGQALQVPDALADPAWKDNPDIKLNMISYFGIPLVWPDNTIFGTLCVLDHKPRDYPDSYQQILWKLKQLIEKDFHAMKQGAAVTCSDVFEEIDQQLDRLIQKTQSCQQGSGPSQRQ